MTGRPINRRRYIHPDKPAGGAAASAVTVTGTIQPNGALVEVAWGANGYDQPTSGWVAATSDALGGWSCTTVRPAAGTWVLWARSPSHPRCGEAVGPVVVT